MASTCCRCLKEHAELCVCARKIRTQTINAETETQSAGFVASFLALVASFFGARREEELAFA